MKYKDSSNVYNDIYINESSIVTSHIEAKGINHDYIDFYYDDFYCGQKTFEKAEVEMIYKSMKLLINKLRRINVNPELVIYSDLNNQLALSTYSLFNYNIPVIGSYSACSSMTLNIILGCSFIESGYNNVICELSSHHATSEKTFRYPLEYGQIKNPESSFTTTSSVSFLLSKRKSDLKVSSSTISHISISDINSVTDIGRLMAISSFNTLKKHLSDLTLESTYYDLIVTGDLGKYGSKVFLEYLQKDNIKINNYLDCGDIIYKAYDSKDINYMGRLVKSGGSGIGCVSSVVLGYVRDMVRKKGYKHILILATGAMHSKISADQGFLIPSISHAVALEVIYDINL